MTYLLLCAVAVVWGVIVYRLFFNDPVDDGSSGFLQPKTVHEPYNQYVAKNDTFKLALNYRDPFLGKINDQPEALIKVIPADHKASIPVKFVPPPVNWTVIRYSGYIINPKTKKIVAIVTVNDQERMMGEGEHFQGLKLLKNKKDSILVSWMGKQKYIKQ